MDDEQTDKPNKPANGLEAGFQRFANKLNPLNNIAYFILAIAVILALFGVGRH